MSNPPVPPVGGTDLPPVPQPPIHVDAFGLADTEIDPARYAELLAAGLRKSNIFKDLIATLLFGLITLLQDLITFAASLFDKILGSLGGAFLAAQAQKSAGFYTLCAELMEDLTGIEVDGAKLTADFQRGGRLTAMTALGGSLFNALASEFAGQEQGEAEGGFTIAPGTGVGGLPEKALTPAGGVNAARSFLGFQTSFAVREGNTDILASILPFGVGHWFKDFAEDFSKNVGIGRLGRVALRPLVQVLVATPLTWAMNLQYRPTLLSASEAVQAWLDGYFTTEQLQQEHGLHGLSPARSQAVIQNTLKNPTSEQLATLLVGGKINADDYKLYMKHQGYTEDVITLIDDANDLAPTRRASLRAAEHFVQEYVTGIITSDELDQALHGMGAFGQGRMLLTDGEIQNLKGLAGSLAAFPRKKMTPAQMKQAYVDATITLQEYEDYLLRVGYSQANVTTLGIEALIAQHKASGGAGSTAHKKNLGTLAGLTVAEMEKAYVTNLISLATFQDFLTRDGFGPDGIVILTAIADAKKSGGGGGTIPTAG